MRFTRSLFAVALALSSSAALAHDIWINKGAYKNPAGEWCCGAEDCGVVAPNAVHAVSGGYSIAGSVTYGEAITGNPADGPLAAAAINRVLDAFGGRRAVHLCFGNYGGQSIQHGDWLRLLAFLNALHADHLVLEAAHRPADDLDALREVDPRLGLGIGVVDVKVNHIETAEEIARRIERAARVLGPERIAWVHPDCGFWMLHRSVADRKIAALTAGRDLYLGRS